jgi:hypothetical protein
MGDINAYAKLSARELALAEYLYHKRSADSFELMERQRGHILKGTERERRLSLQALAILARIDKAESEKNTTKRHTQAKKDSTIQ